MGRRHGPPHLPGHRTTPFASLGPEVAARTITCTSPSKSFNLAGLQVANILIPSDADRAAFRRELAATGYSQPNTLGLTACQAAYSKAEGWLDDGTLFGQCGAGYTRINVACPRATLDEALTRLAQGVGIEDPADLVADLRQALPACAG